MSMIRVSQYRVGIVCALPKVLAAVVAIFDEEYECLKAQDVQDHNTYALGRIHQHNVVVACLPAGVYGTSSAATVATNMLRTFTGIRIGLLVGIGGGIPDLPIHDIRLGDVVVSQPDKFSGVVQYDLGKAIKGSGFEQNGTLDKPPLALLTALSSLQANHKIRGSQIHNHIEAANRKFPAMLDQGYAFPGVEKDCLHCPRCDPSVWWWLLWRLLVWFCALLRCNLCSDGKILRHPRKSTWPVIHYGIIASGNTLIKDATIRNRLRDNFNAKCVEMEAAGLMDNFNCLVIRGICDYADAKRNDDWQEYAALVAAAFAKDLLLYVISDGVEVEKPICEITGVMQEQVSVAKELLEVTRQRNETTEINYQNELHRKCHRFLKTTPYEDFKNINPVRAPGTCQWVFNNKIYLQWKSSERDDLLWISADPGCGKSVLARAIIEEEFQTTEHSKDSVCYFFFKDNGSQDNLSDALRAMLHQLVQLEPNIIHHAVAVSEKGSSVGVHELWKIFLDATVDSQATNILCVFDALDECRKSDRDILIKNLVEFYTTSHVSRTSADSATEQKRLKFLVTSRPYDDIRTEFHFPSHLPSIRLKGEDENDKIDVEINSVIKIRVRDLANKLKLTESFANQLETRLLRMQHRTHLWLFLTIQDTYESLRDSFRPEDEVLPYLPSSVEDAYERILQKVRRNKQKEVKLVFSVILGAKRPLTIGELSIMLGIAINPDKTTVQTVRLDEGRLREQIRQLCGLFVFINHSRVYLIHQTAKEFLVGQRSTMEVGSSWKHCLEPCEIERVIAEVCIGLLLLEDLHPTGRQIARDLGYSSRHSILQRMNQSPVPSLVFYAATNWTDHFRDAQLVDRSKPSKQVLRLYDVIGNVSPWWLSIFWDTITDLPPGLPPDMTSLHIAAVAGHVCVIGFLLEFAKIDINEETGRRDTALSLACIRGFADVVELLLENGADVSCRSSREDPLTLASALGHLEITKTLLKHGADVNAPNDQLETALLVASEYGHLEVAELLLKNGADINIRNKDGYSVLHRATIFNNVEMVELLLKNGADANLRNQDGRSALYEATMSNNVEMVKLLLKSGADVNLRNQDGSSALYYAVSPDGSFEIADLLLRSGAHTRDLESTQLGCIRRLYEATGVDLDTIIANGSDHV